MLGVFQTLAGWLGGAFGAFIVPIGPGSRPARRTFTVPADDRRFHIARDDRTFVVTRD